MLEDILKTSPIKKGKPPADLALIQDDMNSVVSTVSRLFRGEDAWPDAAEVEVGWAAARGRGGAVERGT